MESALEQFLTTGVFAFALTFVRLGSAIMIMPGVGDSFVTARVRLHVAAALSFVLFPLIMPYIPNPLPSTLGMFTLIMMEFVIGLFFGTLARVFMTAMDTAGMVISIASGLGNAQLFNPSLAAQGSLVGAFMSMTGVLILLVTDMHHLLFMGIVESYELFPLGSVPDIGSVAEFFARAVSASFAVGVKVASPFLLLTLLIYVGMGVLGRLMPQVQVFIMALPIQIIIALTALSMTLSAAMMYWLGQFQQGMVFFLSAAGG
ncbi:MAG: flagellar biosynthetic protein FliR [Alphaproteobacteria bacterium]|nr:flagellar biosynthetic protein FliR [Alphaproteobacteria bacterium]